MRFERKYRLEITHLSVVEQIVKNHPASFRKAFPNRRVNNLYFDTPQLHCYTDNQMGIAQRKKYRVRWYGRSEGLITNPVLEIKIRDNALGTKESYPLQPFLLNDLSSLIQDVNKHFNKRFELQPVLFNSYERCYYESFNKKLRLTIDSKMTFRSARVAPFVQTTKLEDPAVVVELKYASDQEDWASDMMQHLPFRMTKNSKYVNGVELTYNS